MMIKTLEILKKVDKIMDLKQLLKEKENRLNIDISNCLIALIK